MCVSFKCMHCGYKLMVLGLKYHGSVYALWICMSCHSAYALGPVGIILEYEKAGELRTKSIDLLDLGPQ